MIKVERHFHKGSPEIIALCQTSKELYNRCNFLMRKSWFSQQHLKLRQLPDINILVNEMKGLNCYKKLHNTKTAAQTIRLVLSDWSNYKKALKSYIKDKSKFIRCPKPPNYKEKLAQVIFYNETIRGGRSKKILTQITPTNSCFSIPSNKIFRQVVITPKTFGFIIEVQYDTTEQIEKENKSCDKKPKLNKDNYCSIDIGLNNLCAITSDQLKSSILINGRIVKSINQWYNKNPCKSRSRKRYWRLENYFHHVSKYIIDLCIKNNIGTMVIGRNKGWKQKINLGVKNNQSFCMVPIYLLLEKIKYKAELAGIDFVLVEESYTSKASYFDNDLLPEYDKNSQEEHVFSGKRKYRGLYISKDGFAVNSDINGSLNIGRKYSETNVIPESVMIRNRSLVARPCVINPLKSYLVKK